MCLYRNVITASQVNELTIGWDYYGPDLYYTVQDSTHNDLPLCCGHDMKDLVFEWHKYCFTFKAGGSFKVCLL